MSVYNYSHLLCSHTVIAICMIVRRNSHLLLLFLFCSFNELGSQILKFAFLSSAKLFHLVQSLYSLLFDWIQLVHSYFFINFCMLFQFVVKDSTFSFFLFTFFFLNILLLHLKISFFLNIKRLLSQDFF